MKKTKMMLVATVAAFSVCAPGVVQGDSDVAKQRINRPAEVAKQRINGPVEVAKQRINAPATSVELAKQRINVVNDKV